MGLLDHITVLDLSPYPPGRYATMLFADMGAEVIGIEIPSGTRKGAFKMLDDDTQPRWLWHQRNKKSMTLNLKSDDGKTIFEQLVKRADVVVESFRPGNAKRLGLDYDSLTKIKPDLVYCAVSGYGQDGPYAQMASHEPNYQALSGVMARNRTNDGVPHMSSTFMGDLVGGAMNAAIAILAALLHRNHSGEGQFIDVSMTAGLVPLLAYQSTAHLRKEAFSPRFLSTLSPALNIVPEQSVYRTRDRRFVAISVVEPLLWKRFCEVTKCENLAPNFLSDDEAVRDRTQAALVKLFEARTRDEWEALNNEFDLGISPVKELEEIFSDPQMLHRNMILEYDYPPVGRTTHINLPFTMSKTPVGGVRTIPRYGEQTDEILASLGYSPEQIKELRGAGAC
jgi:crotonobetainyl-CoA:carnitine CoA-transferase CaiB-like acyl-CoA transferase